MPEVGVNYQGAPVSGVGGAMHIERDFGEQASIEGIVGLELDFNKRGWGCHCRPWGQQAVKSKGGLFDFFGPELVVIRHRRIQPGEIQGDAWPAAEEFIEKTIGFHGLRPFRVDG